MIGSGEVIPQTESLQLENGRSVPIHSFSLPLKDVVDKRMLIDVQVKEKFHVDINKPGEFYRCFSKSTARKDKGESSEHDLARNSLRDRGVEKPVERYKDLHWSASKAFTEHFYLGDVGLDPNQKVSCIAHYDPKLIKELAEKYPDPIELANMFSRRAAQEFGMGKEFGYQFIMRALKDIVEISWTK